MGSVKTSKKISGFTVNTENIGTIYSSPVDNSPNTNHFLFIIDRNIKSSMVSQGMYCSTISEEGMVIGRIEEIYVMNEYYSNPQMVKNFDHGYQSTISSYFPSDKWEDFLAYVKVLGVYSKITTSKSKQFHPTLKRSHFPTKPGSKVQIVQGEMLNDFLGMDKFGLEIGDLAHYNTPVKLNLSRLINKHTAILAMSGAGKSYLVSVLLEELLQRTKTKQGTPGTLLFDVHGEYKFFTDHNTVENQFYAKSTTLYDAKYLQISVPSLTAYDFAKYQPNMSNAQVRELKKILDKFKYELKQDKYEIPDIITQLEGSSTINKKVKSALIGWLYDLNRLRIFSEKNHPVLRKLIQPGRLNILDLSSLISIRKKQIIIAYIMERLFAMRRKEKIPPFFVILEEAHQFCLSEDTEILTKEGWKEFRSIKKRDIIYTFNKDNNRLEEKPIKKIIIRDHNGPIIKLFNSKSLDSLVTFDHRVLCNVRTTGEDRKWKFSKYKFVSANQLPTSFRIPLTANISRNTKCDIDNDLLRIIGWIISDGSKHVFKNSGTFSYEIYQTKPKNVKLMKQVILRRFPKTKINSREREDSYIENRLVKRRKEYTFYFGTEVSKEIDVWMTDGTHRIPSKILKQSSNKQLEVLLDGLIEGDGNIQYSKNNYKYVTYYCGKNKELADDIQYLCTLLGLSAIIRKVKQNQQYKVLISYRRKFAHVRKKDVENYIGKVWDISVENETFIARRNGKPFITGNCPEHSIHKSSISKSILETIAREGRKFYGQICLISQRPVKLSNTVLSQCNTHIIMRVTNPNDLDHIKATSEALTKESTRMISTLPTGNALILGTATTFPIFVNIRKRTCKNTTDEQDLESVCRNYSPS